MTNHLDPSTSHIHSFNPDKLVSQRIQSTKHKVEKTNFLTLPSRLSPDAALAAKSMNPVLKSDSSKKNLMNLLEKKK